MARRKLKQNATTVAGTEVTTCPRADCPDPTLHIAKSGAMYHCIGCWRRFTSSGRLGVAQQRTPPKRWLRKFAPERLNGPPPKLVEMKLTIRLRLRPAKSGPSTSMRPPVSIATEHTDSLPSASIATENDDSFSLIVVSATSVEEEDDDTTSTARYDGATAASLLSPTVDYRYAARQGRRSRSPSTPGIDDSLSGSFPVWYAGATNSADSMFSSTANSRYVAGPNKRSRSVSIATPVVDDIPKVIFPHFDLSLPMTRTTVPDEDCESTGSSPDEMIPVGSSIVRALRLRVCGEKFAVCSGGLSDEVIPIRSSIVRALRLRVCGEKFAVCSGRSTGRRPGVVM